MGNQSIIDYLKGKVEKATKELEQRRVELQQAQAKEQQAVLDLTSYRNTLEAELREAGEPMPQPPSPKSDMHTDDSDDEDINKANVVRTYILNVGPRGAKPRELKLHLKKVGLGKNPNYVYGVLQRLARRKEIERRAGRYVATEKMKIIREGDPEQLPIQ